MSETRKNHLVLQITPEQSAKNQRFNEGSILLPDGTKVHSIRLTPPFRDKYFVSKFGKSEDELLADLKTDLLQRLEAVDLCLNFIQQCIGSQTMTKANATLLA